MGMFNRLRDFFRGSEDTSVVQEEDTYKKSMLAEQIVDLVDKIKRINSFDGSLWRLNNVSSDELKRRSLAELEQLHDSLSTRISELTEQNQIGDQRRESLEASKWTGQRPENLTEHDFDRFQRDEGR